jgi:hypothetical protein
MMMIQSRGERSKRPNEAPVTSMTRLTKNCTLSPVTNAFCKGGELDSVAMETASIVAGFNDDLDGEDRLLIDAESPRGAFSWRAVEFQQASSSRMNPRQGDTVESDAFVLDFVE